MTHAVLLREVQDSDLPIFYEQQLNPEATQMADFPARDREAFMAHWAKIRRDKNNFMRTILYNGQVAGNILSWPQEDKQEVGYWLGKEFWGKGIATLALAQLLNIISTRPLYAYVARRNLASRRVLEKCDFTQYGEDEAGFLFKLEAKPQL
jgi:RimJ/RimL family protein N-acetyltransferase